MGVERDMTIVQLLQAREAFDRRDWALAFERLAECRRPQR